MSVGVGRIFESVCLFVCLSAVYSTRRMAIANGTCVSFCNKPKVHFGLPWVYAPGTIAVNVTGMKKGFNACQTHCSMYPSIFNLFPVIQPVSSKVRHFSTLCTFWPPWVRPWDNRGKVRLHGWKENSMLVKRVAIIYPSIFNRLRAIARYWSEIATFPTPLHLTPRWVCSHWNSGKSLVLRKLESWGYQAVKTVRHNTSVWRTDGHTDVQPINYIDRTAYNIPVSKVIYATALKQQKIN